MIRGGLEPQGGEKKDPTSLPGIERRSLMIGNLNTEDAEQKIPEFNLLSAS
jgi:hypothetical protein